jgi:hypothetical protein
MSSSSTSSTSTGLNSVAALNARLEEQDAEIRTLAAQVQHLEGQLDIVVKECESIENNSNFFFLLNLNYYYFFPFKESM